MNLGFWGRFLSFEGRSDTSELTAPDRAALRCIFYLFSNLAEKRRLKTIEAVEQQKASVFHV